MHSINGKNDRMPSRRPLLAPKLRAMTTNDRLSSSDSGGSIQHNLKQNSTDKSTMTSLEKNISLNGYGTWNRYERVPPSRVFRRTHADCLSFLRPVSASSSRATILPTYTNGFDPYVDHNDPSYRIMRCTSMDAVRGQEQIPLIHFNEKLRAESLLKQKMCSSKKHSHTPTGNGHASESSRSQSFSTNGSNSTHSTRHPSQNGEMSLQKPRVYTHDDRAFVPQPLHNLLSSSSASSTLSVKDKSIKEVPEPRYALVIIADLSLYQHPGF